MGLNETMIYILIKLLYKLLHLDIFHLWEHGGIFLVVLCFLISNPLEAEVASAKKTPLIQAANANPC